MSWPIGTSAIRATTRAARRAVAAVAVGFVVLCVGCASDSCFSPLDFDDPGGNAFRPSFGTNYDHLLLQSRGSGLALRVGVWQFQPARLAQNGPRSDNELREMTQELVGALARMGAFEVVRAASFDQQDFDVVVVPEIVVARSRRRDTFTKTYLCTDIELRALVVPTADYESSFWVDGASDLRRLYTEKYDAGNTMRAEMYQDLALQVYGAFLDLGQRIAAAPEVRALERARGSAPERRPEPVQVDALAGMIARMRAERAALDSGG